MGFLSKTPTRLEVYGLAVGVMIAGFAVAAGLGAQTLSVADDRALTHRELTRVAALARSDVQGLKQRMDSVEGRLATVSTTGHKHTIAGPYGTGTAQEF